MNWVIQCVVTCIDEHNIFKKKVMRRLISDHIEKIYSTLNVGREEKKVNDEYKYERPFLPNHLLNRNLHFNVQC